LVTKDKNIIPIEVVGREIPWEGTTVGVVAIRNIQERKEAEDARRELEHQLFQAERLATVGTVVSGIVHNLKGPLTGILGYAELLKLRHPNEEFINRIQNSAKQMNEMIENILVKGRRKQTDEWIDVHQLLQRELEFLGADHFFKHGVKTDISLGADVPYFLGAYTDLSQVFGNLLRNAVEAMYDRETKILGVSTSVQDDHICVGIQDTGSGIPQSRIATLFDAFVTTKSGDGKTAPLGTGLGLYMVQRLLKECDASIDVSSEEGVGTLFQVRLPLKREAS
jgi:signal transduction histidine kinase